MRNAGLEELQAGIKIDGRNINNLRYADDTTLMAESEEELKNLLMRVKEDSERAGLQLNIKKNLRSWHLAPLLHDKYQGERWLLLLLSLFSCVRLCATPQMAAHQAPPSLGFSRQEHWSGLPFPSPKHENEKLKWSRAVVSDSLWVHGLQPTRLLHPWDFPGKSTGVGCHCLLRGKGESCDKFPLLGLWNHCGWWLQPWNQKTVVSWQ